MWGSLLTSNDDHKNTSWGLPAIFADAVPLRSYLPEPTTAVRSQLRESGSPGAANNAVPPHPGLGYLNPTRFPEQVRGIAQTKPFRYNDFGLFAGPALPGKEVAL